MSLVLPSGSSAGYWCTGCVIVVVKIGGTKFLGLKMGGPKP
jgi:hypothetical protein